MINPVLLDMAFQSVQSLKKQAFIPGNDPVMTGADPSMGGDPAAMGGAPPGGPPMDPSMMGGDPAAMGGASPPPAPAPAPPIQPAMQGGVEPIKPKIDVNVTMLQILKILARIADALKVPIPASEMVATQGDLTQMGMQQETGAPAGGAGGSAIQPIGPVPAASPDLAKQGQVGPTGRAFGDTPIADLQDRAWALQRIREVRAGAN